jgi:hypothetical protein
MTLVSNMWDKNMPNISLMIWNKTTQFQNIGLVAFIVVSFKWEYANKHVDLSMPDYIKDALHKYQHPMPNHLQYAPHNWTFPAYGQRIQYAPLPYKSPLATPQDITRAQGIVSTLLYNARTMDPTLLVPLSSLASQLSTDTAISLDDISCLLDYCSTHPESTIRYC